ncbi:MAG: hypothetical protein KBT00_00595, partial [Bacteroidales bacterium]|nr:hypothetical protein [Candidatus Cacconaster merdequi]
MDSFRQNTDEILVFCNYKEKTGRFLFRFTLVDYYLRISNLEVFVALGKIQQLLDDPIFKNGVGSEINSVIPENTSSA